MLKNLKHKQFCDQYLANGMNARLAYKSVYKSVKSEAGADASASKLLSNPKLQDYIKTQQEKSAIKLEITREDIVREYLELIESSKKEGIDGKGTIKDRSNWGKALSQMSKLLGLDEPDKQDITTNGESINPIAINVNIIKPKKDGK